MIPGILQIGQTLCLRAPCSILFSVTGFNGMAQVLRDRGASDFVILTLLNARKAAFRKNTVVPGNPPLSGVNAGIPEIALFSHSGPSTVRTILALSALMGPISPLFFLFQQTQTLFSPFKSLCSRCFLDLTAHCALLAS